MEVIYRTWTMHNMLRGCCQTWHTAQPNQLMDAESSPCSCTAGQHVSCTTQQLQHVASQ